MTGFLSESVNDSFGSICASPRTGTATVADVWPAAMETVVATAVQSLPTVAVPSEVETSTETVRVSRPPARA